MSDFIKSGKTFVTADLHLDHENICKFLKNDGSKLRPFDNQKEMFDFITEGWNKIVSPNDKVYMLGDIIMNHKNLYLLNYLQGRKVLIKGNHDIAKLNQYLPYFEDIRAYKVTKSYVMSHMPIHPASLANRINIHGHLHQGRVMDNDNIDRRYICVSMEHTGFLPLNFDEIDKGRFV